MNFLKNKFGRGIGIDLGTANTLVFVKDRGIVVNEPSVVAMNVRSGAIMAVGREAKDMVGKTPGHIMTVRPLSKGVISDFEVTEKMLRYFIEKVQTERSLFSARPTVVIGVPLEITEVERKAVEDAVLSAGAREAFLIEEPMAASIGSRLPIEDAVGNMIVDIGGGTAEVAVISLGGVVNWRSVAVAGDEMNRAIVNYARDVCSLMLGERVAEEIKIKIGSAVALDAPLEVEMRGRDLTTGLPKEIIIGDAQIREALAKSVRTIIEQIKMTLESTPPELVADIYERGIVMTGGGAMLRGLDRAIAQATQIPVRVAEDPLTAVVRGTGVLLDNLDLLRVVSLPTARS